MQYNQYNFVLFQELQTTQNLMYYLFHFHISLTILLIIFIKSVKYLNW